MSKQRYGLLLALLGMLVFGGLPLSAPTADLVIAHARLIDGTGVVRERVHIVVTGDRIARLSEADTPPGGKTSIDATGTVVVPGLIDLHQHLFAHLTLDGDAALDAYLAYGVTTMFLPKYWAAARAGSRAKSRRKTTRTANRRIGIVGTVSGWDRVLHSTSQGKDIRRVVPEVSARHGIFCRNR